MTGGKEQVSVSPFRVWSWNPFKNITFAACRVTVTQGQTPERIDVSFAYLPLYTGDYIRDTQHLSCSEHGIYLKMLIHCWDQKGPVPLDERRLMGIVNARSTDEIEAMRRVLVEYFIRMEDGWYNHRMQREIERCENISSSRSDAGKKGYQAKAKQMPSKCLTLAEQVPLSPSPSPSPSLTPNQEDQKPTRFSAREYLLKKGVQEQEANDWLRVRKEKKLTPTRAAIDAIEKEAIKGGIDLPQAIHHCCENAWAGFKVAWLAKSVTEKQEERDWI